MVERQHESLADHVRNLQEQASFSAGIINPETHAIQRHTAGELTQQLNEVKRRVKALRFSEELSLSDMFGVPVEDYRELATILFGEDVEIGNITEKQNARIEAAHRALIEGWERLLKAPREGDIPL